jgi:hypothetical protein
LVGLRFAFLLGPLYLARLVQVALDHCCGLWGILAEECWCEPGEMGEDVALFEGMVEGGQGWREQGSVGKGDQFGWCGGADGGQRRVAQWRGRRCGGQRKLP